MLALFIFGRRKNKKILTLIMAVFMLLSLVSCVFENGVASSNSASSEIRITYSSEEENNETSSLEEVSYEEESSQTEPASSSKPATSSSKSASSSKSTNSSKLSVSSSATSSKTPSNTVTVPIQSETVGDLVWVPINGGTKYHSKSTCSKMKDPIQVSKETAIQNGYEVCKRYY